MIAHKCDGCRYKGEHVEMGFKPFGVCYKERNLIKAEENYKAETCPYKFALPQLYKTDSEPLPDPEPWPKENPYLKPLPEINENDNIINIYGQASEIERQTRTAAEALAALGAAAETLRPIIETLAETLRPIIKTIGDVLEKIIYLYPNKRVIYLSKHGKGRTKKKNINRILKWVNEQGKEPSKKRTSRGFIKYIERDGETYALFAQN